ncbi:hypothetical protein E4U19_002264 [Claviceps sp. Clav32 group G5]|nr:hypothetical protein E4U19_002264 [Claviceps sp. Clav32 group G5]
MNVIKLLEGLSSVQLALSRFGGQQGVVRRIVPRRFGGKNRIQWLLLQSFNLDRKFLMSHN